MGPQLYLFPPEQEELNIQSEIFSIFSVIFGDEGLPFGRVTMKLRYPQY